MKFCVLESIVTAALPILTKLAISGASLATAKTGGGNKLVFIARLITFPSSLLPGITPTIFFMLLAISVAFAAALHKDSIFFLPKEASGFNTFNNSVLVSFRLSEIVFFTEFNLSIFISCEIAISILLFSSAIFSSTSSLLFGIALAAFATFSSKALLLGF
ncbi:hypothetical protein KNCP2_12020 [Candidatus Rickettsia kedanie]|uniref:Uncharacterized protein n=1 Tax=Candidatus Rickettsia kedanie TaxID=3115352 RepID=A0ABP9TUJ0_9RICK